MVTVDKLMQQIFFKVIKNIVYPRLEHSKIHHSDWHFACSHMPSVIFFNEVCINLQEAPNAI